MWELLCVCGAKKNHSNRLRIDFFRCEQNSNFSRFPMSSRKRRCRDAHAHKRSEARSSRRFELRMHRVFFRSLLRTGNTSRAARATRPRWQRSFCALVKTCAHRSAHDRIVEKQPGAPPTARHYARRVRASLKMHPKRCLPVRALGRARFDEIGVNLRRGRKYIFRTTREIQIQI